MSPSSSAVHGILQSNSNSVDIIRSVIDSDIVLSNDKWTVCVVSKGIHGFLIFERCCTGDTDESGNFWYRADLRPKNLGKSIGIGTKAQITFEKVTEEEFRNFKSYDYIAVRDVTPDNAKRLLERIQSDIEENAEKYCLTGNGTSDIVQKKDANYSNCISYCQKIMEEELQIKIGEKKQIIKVPPWIVAQGSKEKRRHKKCCTLM